MVIIGAGGHGRVVLSTALSANVPVQGFLDDHAALQGNLVDGYPVLGRTDQLAAQSFQSAVFGLGHNMTRQLLRARYQAQVKDLIWGTLTHSHAYVHASVQIGEGTVIFAGAVIQPNVTLGPHCIINTGVTIDHDCVIGAYTHLAPGVHLAGGVHIGQGSFLGIGSVVIQSIQIGEWVVVGAGSVVVRDIPDKKTVMGVPAKESRR